MKEKKLMLLSAWGSDCLRGDEEDDERATDEGTMLSCVRADVRGS